VADPASERVIMEIDHPQANHNSGHIAFGPDGYLYAPMGDGGNANDVGLGHVPQGNAQDLTNILGDILRLDIDNPAPDKPYKIPADNPYADGRGGARPEIYASGFRNPYHVSFDAGGDHHLYAGDAGQDRFEEIDDVEKGGNYGWRIREGKHCFDPNDPSHPPASCPDKAANGDRLIDPVLEYNHTEILGSVVIGGYVYRGGQVPDLHNMYVFGDYSRDRLKPDGELFMAATSGKDAWQMKELQVELDGDPDPGPGFGHFVIAFGQDDNRELYASLTAAGGPAGSTAGVYRLSASAKSSPGTASPGASRGKSGSGRGAWWWLPIIIAVLAIFAALANRLRTSEPQAPRG
jgi:hypothetical protein